MGLLLFRVFSRRPPFRTYDSIAVNIFESNFDILSGNTLSEILSSSCSFSIIICISSCISFNSPSSEGREIVVLSLQAHVVPKGLLPVRKPFFSTVLFYLF